MPRRLYTEKLFDRFYYNDPSFVDGTSQFHSLCLAHIPKGSGILEIGPGPANPTSEFLAGLGPVVGVDVSDELFGNPWLREAHIYEGLRLPFPDSSFNACVSDYVLEHIGHAEQHFREVSRVLAPGGVYCFRTPNLWHYVSLASRILPHSAQLRFANLLRGLPGGAHEPYPAFYRANSERSIRRMCDTVGLAVRELVMVEKEPSYGRASPVLFFPMMLFERSVNGPRWLSHFRANIFCALEKPASGQAGTRC